MSSDGPGFVVVWQSKGSSDTDSIGWSIQGQRYRSDGSPGGDEFQVNTHTFSDQLIPVVAPYGDDAFVVAWTSGSSSGDDTDAESILAQRYLAAMFADGFESGDTSAWSTTVP